MSFHFQCNRTKFQPYLALILGWLLLPMGSHAQEDLLPAYTNEIRYANGLAYFGGTPFTGILVDTESKERLGEYRQGKKTGVHTSYHRPGVKKEEGNYADGEKMGSHMSWHPNGQRKAEYAYFNGAVVDGRYTLLDTEGNRTVVEIYEGGRKVGQAVYQGDDLIEPVTRYYPGGSMKQIEGSLKNSKPHGLWTEWYADGAKEKEEHYVDGALHGRVTTYWPTGERKREQVYEGGSVVSTTYVNNIDPATCVRHMMRPGAYLFMALKGDVADTTLIMVQFNFTGGQDRSLDSREGLRSNAIGALSKRMIPLEGADSKNYDMHPLGYSIEFSDPRTDAIYDDGRSVISGKLGTIETQVPAGYRGRASLGMKITDLRSNKVLFNGMVSGTSGIHSEKSAALAVAPALVREEIISRSYIAWRIKAQVARVVESNRLGIAKQVELDCGVDLSLAKRFQFNVYKKGAPLGARLGIVEVARTEGNTSICTITEGAEIITQHLNAGEQLTAVSAY
jgi:antitoxin component YwqK of YwqJK toxin-antitoxin module